MNPGICVQEAFLHINPESDRAMGHLCMGLSSLSYKDPLTQEGGWLRYVYRDFLHEM
jgi:hypothetical protein